MKLKNILTTILLIFVAASIGYFIYQEITGVQNNTQDRITSEDKYIVYYMHRTKRCPVCIKIENYTYEAIRTGFTEQFQNKLIEFRKINIEAKGNEHYEKDYQLNTQSIIIVEFRDGKQQRWKNLNKIWELVTDKDEFIRYIQKEIKLFMDGGY